MSTDILGVIDARLSKLETEISGIDAKIRVATNHLNQQKAELTKERNFYIDLKREAGIMPPPAPRGNPAFRKKKPE